jgi:hypothetical protein
VEGERLRALVELDAGNRTRGLDDVDQRRAIGGLLAKRLVIEPVDSSAARMPLPGATMRLAMSFSFAISMFRPPEP